MAASASSQRPPDAEPTGSHTTILDGTLPPASDGGGSCVGPGDRDGSDGRQPPPLPDPKTRCCRGLLYFSQAMLEAGETPTCTGLRRTLHEPPDVGVAPDTVPGGDFKYLCLGYSLYDEAELREAWKAASKDPTGPVAVPYCEGLEVVSAADLASAPLAAAATVDAGGAAVASEGASGEQRRRPIFSQPPIDSETARDWSKFPERFGRTANKIVERMQQNASYLAKHMQQNAVALKDGLFGKPRDR